MPEFIRTHAMLVPALALIVLTLLVAVAMVATRLPALARAKIPPQGARYTADLTMLPSPARDVADNYNHLLEQPTIFYALVFYAYLAGQQDGLNIGLAWAYVGLRVVHTLIQTTVNLVAARFYVFAASTVVLMVMAGRDVIALFG